MQLFVGPFLLLFIYYTIRITKNPYPDVDFFKKNNNDQNGFWFWQSHKDSEPEWVIN